MAFQRIHKIVAYIMAVQGLGLLAMSGELTLPGTIAVGVAVLASWFVEGSVPAAKRWTTAWNVVTVAIFAVQVVRWMAGEGLPIVAVQFAAFLQVNKLFNRRRQTDHDHIAILSLMHLIVSAILYTDMSYALVFILYTVTTPWMLVLGQIRREVEAKYWDRANSRSIKDLERVLRSRRIISGRFLAATAFLSIPIYVMTAALFLFFPRIGFGLLAASDPSQRHLTGFSDEIVIGDLTPLFDDPTVILRAEFPDGPPRQEVLESIYWRGAAYDRFDGEEWHRTLGHGSLVTRRTGLYELGPDSGEDPTTMLRLDVYLQPIYPKVLFVPQETAFVGVPAPARLRVMGHKLRWGPGAEVRYSDPAGTGIRYMAYVAAPHIPPRPYSGRSTERSLSPYLDMPPVSPRLLELAGRFASQPDPLERASAVETYLRTSLGYTKTVSRKVPDGMSAVDAFLFEWREGNCEYFSTAMVLLLRSTGVPARNITGFVGGAWNDIGGYLAVREADAHSWVEVYTPDEGWVLFDPTPPSEALPTSHFLAFALDFIDTVRLSWHKHIIAYDLTRQAEILRKGFHGWRRLRTALGTAGSFIPEGAARIARRFSPLVVVIVVVALYLAFRRRRSEPPLPSSRPERRAHRKALSLVGLLDRKLEEIGMRRPASRPPLSHALLVSPDLEDPTPLHEVVYTYNSTRFGGRPLTDETFAAMRGRIDLIRLQRTDQRTAG